MQPFSSPLLKALGGGVSRAAGRRCPGDANKTWAQGGLKDRADCAMGHGVGLAHITAADYANIYGRHLKFLPKTFCNRLQKAYPRQARRVNGQSAGQ